MKRVFDASAHFQRTQDALETGRGPLGLHRMAGPDGIASRSWFSIEVIE